MAPSDQELACALRDFIKETVENDEDDLLTVRYVRQKVEEKLSLERGFFVTQAGWKDKSKKIIIDHSKLLDAKEKAAATAEIEAAAPPSARAKPKATKKEANPIEKAPKRVAQSEQSRPAKRRKKAATPSDISEDEDEPTDETSDASIGNDESVESSFDGSDSSDVPKSRKFDPKAKAKARFTTKNTIESEDESSEAMSDVEDSEASTPPKKATPKKVLKSKTSPKKISKAKPSMKRNTTQKADDSEDAVSREDEASKEEETEEDKKTTKMSKFPEATKSKSLAQHKRPPPVISDGDQDEAEEELDAKSDSKQADTTAHDSDSSAMSVLIDESPKKRGKQSKSEGSITSKSSKTKAPKAAKIAKEKPAEKALSASEQQIKTLQSQLLKCGIRKIWQFELKQYDGDNKAKIRHLEGMLRDIGMKGRFSNERAREIKEMRELQADLEAVQQGEKSWGLESGRRNRGQRKSLKEISVTEEDDEDTDEEEDGGKTRSRSEDANRTSNDARAARMKADMAFLGDESESD